MFTKGGVKKKPADEDVFLVVASLHPKSKFYFSKFLLFWWREAATRDYVCVRTLTVKQEKKHREVGGWERGGNTPLSLVASSAFFPSASSY